MTTTASRRDDIQGIRAVAMLMVAAYHADLPLHGAFTGPDVFFVVSGYVITGMLLREAETAGGISIGRFYLRRVRRLLPALALLSVATVVAAALLFSPIGERQQVTGRAVRAATTIVANLHFLRETGGYFQPAAQDNPFLHTWTLSVEEQFYLVFPVLLAGLWKIGRGRRTMSIVGVLALACALSLAACVALSYGHAPSRPSRVAAWIALHDPVRVAFFVPITRAWEFLAGALLAMIPPALVLSTRVRAWSAAAGVALLTYTIVFIRTSDVFPGILAAAPVLGSVGLLIAGRGEPASFVTRLLSSRPMVWIGDRSYSWYLWHWPFAVYARTLYIGKPDAPMIAVALALIPAALSFRFVEEPIRRRRIWPSTRAAGWIAATCVAVPLACATGLVAAADRSWGQRDLASIRETTKPDHIDITAICASFSPLGDPQRATCLWPASPSRGTVLLLGDSNAGHFSEAFIAAANALGYDAQIATAGGCPFLVRPQYTSDGCRGFIEGTIAAVARRTPAYAAIVTSNATMGYLDGSLASQFLADLSPSAPVTRPNEIAGWIASVQRAVEALGRRSPVIVVGAVPQFSGVPQCLRPTLLSAPVAGCGHWPAAFAARWRDDIVAAERPAVEALGATYLDAGTRLCDPKHGCSAFIDGTLVYRDGAHLNVASARYYTPDFEAAIVAAVRSRP